MLLRILTIIVSTRPARKKAATHPPNLHSQSIQHSLGSATPHPIHTSLASRTKFFNATQHQSRLLHFITVSVNCSPTPPLHAHDSLTRPHISVAYIFSTPLHYTQRQTQDDYPHPLFFVRQGTLNPGAGSEEASANKRAGHRRRLGAVSRASR